MSAICGTINCKGTSGAETLVKLSKDMGTKYKVTYETVNSYNTFIGISRNDSQKYLTNIIYNGVRYVCAFCGELYNTAELISKIQSELGYNPIENQSFGTIAAWCYILWGGFSPKMLDGKFAYCIYSEGIFKASPHTPKMFLSRDRFGFIPIYYHQPSSTKIMFSTELGGILKARKEKNFIDKKAIWQIFYLDGKSLPGYTLIKDVYELNAGCCAYIDCRDTCKIMIKCYDNFKNCDAVDVDLDKLIKASKNSMRITSATKKLEICNSASAKEIIDASVKAIHYPVLPHIYSSIINLEKNSIVYSNIGCEMIKDNSGGIMKGFFPWIHDPYANIEIIDNKRTEMQSGFEYINSERECCLNTDSGNYYINSVYRFYLPMLLKHIYRVADAENIRVQHPFCNKSIATCIIQKGNICTENAETLLDSFEFERDIYKNAKSEFVDDLLQTLQNTLTNSDSIIKYLCDKNKLSDTIGCRSNIKALTLLYATHSFAEEFRLDLYAL